MESKPTHETLLGTGAVATLLNIRRDRLIALLDWGKLPEPSVRVPGRRLFSAEDVEKLRVALKQLEDCRDTQKEEGTHDETT